jgi:hypothetical protein
VNGPVISLTGYFVPETDISDKVPLNCYLTLENMNRVRARVSFDILSEYNPTLTSTASTGEPVCYVLMITASMGIAIKVDDEDPTRYKRVGYLCFQYKYWDSRGCLTVFRENLDVTDFPDAQSIILV